MQNSKIITRQSLASRITKEREKGRKIVLTNGCFDILHRGHVTYLRQAKTFGDVLIVGVNSDESIHRIKGPERPINSLADRMEVLAALGSVDLVVPFTESTAVRLVKLVKPDVYIKGGDYSLETLPEAHWTFLYGGRVELLPYIADQSTTQIIKKIQAQPKQVKRKSHNGKPIKLEV